MGEQDITHNNHYVPRFYLKNWSEDGKTIYTYSLLVSDKNVPYWRKESIRHVAVWHDLYTRKIEQREIDDFEEWFDREFEAPAKPVFDKLLKNEQITKAESIIISRFVAAQHIRTPSRLNSMLAWGRDKIPDIFQDVLNKLNEKLASGSFEREVKPITEETELLPIKVSLDREQSLACVESIVGKSMYLYFVKHLLTKTVEHMYNHRWYVVQVVDGISFPTTDDPVICLNFRSETDYDFKGGWGRKHGNIIMPLSPDKLLFTQIGDNGTFDSLNNSPYWSSLFRKMIIQHAHRFVFADKPQRGMLAVNPRMVNKVLYDEERKAMETWHEENMFAEESLK